jgi:perosamine synthetase
MEEFEDLVSRYVGQEYGIAVSSGTAGLHLCVRALGIGRGDEVIVPSFTFIAAANAVRYEGAVPVFVDIESRYLNIDPDRIEAAITPRTRAIIAVHTFGCPADMDAILDIAKRYHLRVIEDACEAIGAKYRGQTVGTFGDAAVFAFYPNKQITTGEGGLIVTRDPLLAREIRAMRNHGRFETDEWHQHSILGYNYRLSEINCALGCAQMRRIEDILALRDRVARKYEEELRDLSSLVLPPTELERGRPSWFVYVVRLESHFSMEQRDSIAHELKQQGIGCGRYFAPIHTQPAYAGQPSRQPLPITEFVSQRALALPFFSRLDDERIRCVTESLRAAIEAAARQ